MDEFTLGIYSEHLEEASFLYNQRRYLFGRPDYSWARIADFEERLDAHIDGLYYGGDDALELCAERIEAGEAGECYAALSVYARLERLDLIRLALEKLDEEDVEKVTAFTEALKLYWPEPRGLEDMRALLDIKSFGVIAPVIIGFKRLAPLSDLLTHPNCRTQKALPSFCWAAGRLRDERLTRLLDEAAQSDDEQTLAAYVLAGLRMGGEEALNICRREADLGKSWALAALGICGGKACGDHLKKMFSSGKISPEVLLALGTLGDPACFDLLCSQLPLEEYAPAAAEALERITGAGLYETAFIPDPIDESELNDAELAKHRRGEPIYPPGKEPGKTVTRLSQKAEDRQKWIQNHRKDFVEGSRYRHGQLLSPGSLLETLQSDKSPAYLRQMACDELVIRYGIDIGLEADDMFVRQRRMMAGAEQKLRADATKYQAGAWYFGGKPTA